MLILLRKVGQSIMIGNSMVVTLMQMKGDKAAIGITAPKDVPVHREEVYISINKTKVKNEKQNKQTVFLSAEEKAIPKDTD